MPDSQDSSTCPGPRSWQPAPAARASPASTHVRHRWRSSCVSGRNRSCSRPFRVDRWLPGNARIPSNQDSPSAPFPLRARQSGRLFLARILVVSDSLVESRREVCKLRCSQISVLTPLRDSFGTGLHRGWPAVGKESVTQCGEGVIHCFVCSLLGLMAGTSASSLGLVAGSWWQVPGGRCLGIASRPGGKCLGVASRPGGSASASPLGLVAHHQQKNRACLLKIYDRMVRDIFNQGTRKSLEGL